MLNPLARSQERQNINLLRSNEKTNSLQDNLVRDFFKRRQTNRSPIIARPILKSPNSSSTSSLKGFIFSFIKNDINDVHSYILKLNIFLICYLFFFIFFYVILCYFLRFILMNSF